MVATLEIDEKLLADTERVATETRRTVAQVVEDALRAMFERQTSVVRGDPVKLHTVGGEGLHPGVDLNNNAALADLMDEHDGFIGR